MTALPPRRVASRREGELPRVTHPNGAPEKKGAGDFFASGGRARRPLWRRARRRTFCELIRTFSGPVNFVGVVPFRPAVCRLRLRGGLQRPFGILDRSCSGRRSTRSDPCVRASAFREDFRTPKRIYPPDLLSLPAVIVHLRQRSQ